MAEKAKTVKFQLGDLIKAFENTLKQSQCIRNEINEKLGFDTGKDARFLFFKFLAETVQAYFLTQQLLPKAPDLEFIQKGTEKVDEAEKEKFMSDLSNAYIDEMRNGLFIGFFVNFEMSIKIIAQECIGLTIKDFDKDLAKLIDVTGVNPDYKKLGQILIYTRNTIHFGGIRTRDAKDDTNITYKEKTYAFKNGSSPEGFDFISLLWLLDEIMNFFRDLVFSEPVKKHALIPHPYINFFPANE